MREAVIPPALALSNTFPFEYQWEGIRTLVSKRRYLLMDEPGLGKTIQCIVAANAVGYANQKAGLAELKILVVTVLSMVPTWKREIMKWATGGAYTVINHDKLAISGAGQYIKKWDIIIFDEAHLYLRNRDTKRARAALEMLQHEPVVWMATATPANKSAEDYFLMFSILLPGIFTNMTKTDFVKQYCNANEDFFFSKTVRRGARCVPVKKGLYKCTFYTYSGFRNTDKLNDILSRCAIKRTEAEVGLQLPELRVTTQYVETGFNNFNDDEIEDLLLTVKKGAEPSEKYHDKLKANALTKLPAVVETLSTYPPEKKAVIFAWHRDVVDTVSKTVRAVEGRLVDCITGATSETERLRIMDEFQTGSLNTLVINMKSGGTGITLTAATAGIYIEFPYAADLWKQSMKRIHRIGSKKPVQVIKLINSGSVDEKIWEVLTERLDKLREIEG